MSLSVGVVIGSFMWGGRGLASGAQVGVPPINHCYYRCLCCRLRAGGSWVQGAGVCGVVIEGVCVGVGYDQCANMLHSGRGSGSTLLSNPALLSKLSSSDVLENTATAATSQVGSPNVRLIQLEWSRC